MSAQCAVCCCAADGVGVVLSGDIAIGEAAFGCDHYHRYSSPGAVTDCRPDRLGDAAKYVTLPKALLQERQYQNLAFGGTKILKWHSIICGVFHLQIVFDLAPTVLSETMIARSRRSGKEIEGRELCR